MKLILTFLLAIASNILIAQDSLSMLLDKEAIVQTMPKKDVPAFNGTQLVNSRTTETLHKYQLAFVVGHKFGDLGGDFGGEKSFFGLENSTDVRIGFDYGITDKLTVGISRAKGATAIRQLYELSAKYKLVQQSDDKNIPFTVTLFGNAVASSMASNIKANTPDHFDNFNDRMSFTSQLLLSRRFSDRLSIMVMPTFVHSNYVINMDENNVFAAGIGGRYKFNKHFALLVDYFKVLRSQVSTDKFKAAGINFYAPLGIGLEVGTGGHVFDFNFTNSTALLENQFIPYTNTSWGNWRFRWAFNMSRIFTLKSKK
jgi:Membrane bound beta barrel domain (DUF5777)